MTAPLNTDELLVLCGKVRDQDITPEEFARLESLLVASYDALLFYQQFMSVTSGLEQFSRLDAGDSMEGMSVENCLDVDTSFDWADDSGSGDDAVAAPLETRTGQTYDRSVGIEPFAVEGPSELDVLKRLERSALARKRGRGRSLAMAAACSGLVLVLLALIPIGIRQINDVADGPDTSAPTTLTDVLQAEWSGEIVPEVGSELAGRYSLISGAARIRYGTHAELLVQAPATFSVTQVNHVELVSGSVNAWIPPSAKGFRVDTPYGSVVDHGTRIGVVVDESAGLELHVFEGSAELIAGKADTGRLLHASEAGAVSAKGVGPVRIDVEPAYFARSLETLAFLPRVSGDVELRVSPPRSVRTLDSDLVDLGRAAIFAEQRGTTLTNNIHVTIDAAGTPTSLESHDVRIPAGTRLDSFLVHYAVPREARRTDRVLVARGSLTFARPIIGVRTHLPGYLSKTLGHPATEYPFGVAIGLEDPTDDDSDTGDWIRLSEDRHTLEFRLRIHGREASSQEDFLDQFRILVEAAQPTPG